ncbi:hypothetical protein GQ457_18G017590 [Hibiscus cannabinus]
MKREREFLGLLGDVVVAGNELIGIQTAVDWELRCNISMTEPREENTVQRQVDNGGQALALLHAFSLWNDYGSPHNLKWEGRRPLEYKLKIANGQSDMKSKSKQCWKGF